MPLCAVQVSPVLPYICGKDPCIQHETGAASKRKYGLQGTPTWSWTGACPASLSICAASWRAGCGPAGLSHALSILLVVLASMGPLVKPHPYPSLLHIAAADRHHAMQLYDLHRIQPKALVALTHLKRRQT